MFGVYIHDWLNKPEKSRAGCYVGQHLIGAFVFADDIILHHVKNHDVLLDMYMQTIFIRISSKF